MLLLEAGPPDRNPWIHIPLGYARTYVDPAVNWKFETEPQPQLGNRRLYLPRGKTLGGSSSINGMVYIRGNHGDYDEWRQRGCEGWDWDSVLPYFKKAQNQTRGADDFHGVGGPLHVSDQPGRFELADAVLEACVQAGIPRNPDFNGAQQEGCGYYQTTTLNRRRWSAAQAYLRAGTQTPQSGDPHRRACDARADREQPRGRRRIPYRRKAARPPARAARSLCRAAPMARRSFCCCRVSAPHSICRTWASRWSATCPPSAPTCTTISTPMWPGGAARRSR